MRCRYMPYRLSLRLAGSKQLHVPPAWLATAYPRPAHTHSIPLTSHSEPLYIARQAAGTISAAAAEPDCQQQTSDRALTLSAGMEGQGTQDAQDKLLGHCQCNQCKPCRPQGLVESDQSVTSSRKQADATPCLPYLSPCLSTTTDMAACQGAARRKAVPLEPHWSP